MTAKKKTMKKSDGTMKGMSNDEQVGFHKGSISVLSKEREELGRILNIVEQLMQMHVAALRELGVDLEAEAEQLVKSASKKGPGKPQGKPPIEDII